MYVVIVNYMFKTNILTLIHTKNRTVYGVCYQRMHFCRKAERMTAAAQEETATMTSTFQLGVCSTSRRIIVTPFHCYDICSSPLPRHHRHQHQQHPLHHQLMRLLQHRHHHPLEAEAAANCSRYCRFILALTSIDITNVRQRRKRMLPSRRGSSLAEEKRKAIAVVITVILILISIITTPVWEGKKEIE